MSRSSLDRSRESFASLFDGVDGPAVARVSATLGLPSTPPLSAYAALSDENDYGFLLESAEKTPSSDPDGAFSPGTATDRHARYSFVGYDPEAVVTVDTDGASVEALGGRAARYVDPDEGDVLAALRGALPDVERVGFDDDEGTARQRLDGGLVGFLAYDAVYDLWLEEVGVERPDAHADETATPDAQFVLTTKTLVFDHATDSVSLVFTPVVGPDENPDSVYDELDAEATRLREKLAVAETPDHGGFRKHGETAESREAYEAAVRETKRHVLDGDIYQGVISRTRELRGEIDPLGLYASLREVNPSPYMYLLRHGDRTVVGASPETLVSVRGDRVVANPIAGTCPRGNSPVDDRRLAGEMLADAKERSEHTMLVDLARNDVRRVSEAGSVRVEEFMNVLKYSHVQHIESTVSGRLDADSDAFDATRASFPAGTLSGAPKVRAMEIIDALETTPRGLYGGGVGYYSWTGDADVAIVIRTATIERGGEEDSIRVRAGAGIVADSDPTAEYEETEQKMGGVLDALERIEARGADDERTAAEAPR
ncbi:anthranilate synthase component I [Haloprofundus salilacus]|uniref:anthranilate synthase component I n=1 Tax=Haloprofundus salilacus TaxID=2876190 RepID=UPI001CCBEB6C|nr:anthranilate synthase component I [Haloprofundus salilacus]